MRITTTVDADQQVAETIGVDADQVRRWDDDAGHRRRARPACRWFGGTGSLRCRGSVMSASWRKGTCRSCHQPVIWAITEAGKRMPVDPIPVEHGTVQLSGPMPRATVVSKGGRAPGQKLYVAHFAECPKAAEHRKAAPAQSTPPVMPQDGLFSEVAR